MNVSNDDQHFVLQSSRVHAGRLDALRASGAKPTYLPTFLHPGYGKGVPRGWIEKPELRIGQKTFDSQVRKTATFTCQRLLTVLQL